MRMCEENNNMQLEEVSEMRKSIRTTGEKNKHMSRVFQDPKRHLEEHINVLMASNIVQCLGAMLHTVVFK